MLSKTKPHRIFSGEIPLPQRLLEIPEGWDGSITYFLKVKTLFSLKITIFSTFEIRILWRLPFVEEL